jgi:hypothetical protein
LLLPGEIDERLVPLAAARTVPDVQRHVWKDAADVLATSANGDDGFEHPGESVAVDLFVLRAGDVIQPFANAFAVEFSFHQLLVVSR